MKVVRSLDARDIKRIIKKCYRKFYISTFDNLDKMAKFLETYKLPKWIQEEIQKCNNRWMSIKEI